MPRARLSAFLGAVVVLVGMALVAATVLAAPPAAVTGTVQLDEAWYTITLAGDFPGAIADGSRAKVTVTDTDANVTVETSQLITLPALSALESTGQAVTLSGGEEIVGLPTFLETGDTDCVTGTEDTNLNVSVFNAATGSIIVQAFNPIAGGNQTVCFDKGQEDAVNVQITSTQDPTGITVSATETGVDSGQFQVTITLAEVASSATALNLQALDLDTVTAKYTDSTPTGGGGPVLVSDTANVETSGPTFSSLLPVDGLRTQARQPSFSGTINDPGGSGIDVSTIRIVFDSGPAAGENAPTVTGSDGDTSVTFNFIPPMLNEGAYNWYVESSDMVGNPGRTDADGGTIGNQDFGLIIDLTPPWMIAAETGRWWDDSAKLEKSNKLDALVVIFTDDLNPATVAPTDFTVEGVAPTAAQMFAEATQSKVYLTLASDLGVDDEPMVAIGGSVGDLAGNTLNVGFITATDMISAAPTPTPTPGPPPTATPTSVPGLTQWGLLGLGGMFAALLLWRARRRLGSESVR
jgi:hypothetical protein